MERWRGERNLKEEEKGKKEKEKERRKKDPPHLEKDYKVIIIAPHQKICQLSMPRHFPLVN